MKKNILIILLLAIAISNLQADDLKIAVAAGYKKPLLKIIKIYNKENKADISGIFGNMKQILTQAKRTNIDIIVGDKNYLSKKSKLTFEKYQEIGKGKLVLVFSKKIKIDDFRQITNSNIKKIAMPQPKKTIYGSSGMAFLKNSNLYDKIKDKLYIVTTPLQVATYLVANEVDIGIINLTTALANKKNIGGYIKIPQKYYPDISIIAGVLPECEKNKECQKFMNFLSSKISKDIFNQYGL